MLKSSTKILAEVLQLDSSNIQDIAFEDIYTDTRQRMDGGIFLALIGENFDAHHYIKKAEEMGAVAIIASQKIVSNLPVLLVKDTQKSLSDIAQYHLKNIQPKIVGITGSNGKTTTKNLLANILNLSAPTLKTQGNLNNHLGVPMTLLKLKPHHQYAVIEMGANHIGEIEHLRCIVKPDVAVITNTGDAHIGEFGSKANLIKAKGEIYSKNSKNIVNTQTQFKGDISFTPASVQDLNNSKIGDVFASDVKKSKFTLNIHQQQIQINLKLIGTHNIDNALAASACAYALGIDLKTIKSGLESTTPENGRLNIIHTDQFTLIDDSYNASPSSITAALETLKTFSGELVIVLGDMAELGTQTIALHQKIGLQAQQISPNFYTFGPLAKHYQAQHFASQTALAEHILQHHQGATLLIKGSRIVQLDKLVKLLQK
jgi:UDP-N-acetylmuramoyl-tripeptide--D-alanyl-D-alanine ligase